MTKSPQKFPSNRPFFKKIAYSTCWEDFEIIDKALKINKNDKLISISSAGCNVLNALLKNPKKILAVDFNPHQNYLLELKIKAIKHLSHKQFLELIGVIESDRRRKIYKKIRKKLTKNTRNFWDKNIKLIKKGITYNGRQEKYIRLIGRIIRSLKGNQSCEKFLKTKDREKQKEYFDKNIKGLIWDAFFKILYSKPVMLMVKDRLVFNQTDENSYHIKFRKRAEYAVKEIPVYKNPFASFALRGKYLNEEYYPEYLKKENFEKLKKNVDKIELKNSTVKGLLEKLPKNSYSKINLSNSLDWITPEEFIDTLKEITRVLKNNGKFCYFNTLITRNIPKNTKNIKSYKKKANELLKKDRAFLYGNFEIGTIKKGRKEN